MLEYIKESWQIFLSNLSELTGTKGALALVFLFAVFIIFYNISGGFRGKKGSGDTK